MFFLLEKKNTGLFGNLINNSFFLKKKKKKSELLGGEKLIFSENKS